MIRALMITEEHEAREGLLQNLADNDVTCTVTSRVNGISDAIGQVQPDLYLLEIDTRYPDKDNETIIHITRRERDRPIIALVPEELLGFVSPELDIDDFILEPYAADELLVRIRRVLEEPDEAEESDDEVIRRNGLVVNLTSCDARVDGVKMELTFKEFELLKLLAANPGRVYTRETLLDLIWGYDYFGGDRTVDVHIRRLRSKIEGTGHTFIETVRNVGYRFTQSG